MPERIPKLVKIVLTVMFVVGSWLYCDLAARAVNWSGNGWSDFLSVFIIVSSTLIVALYGYAIYLIWTRY